MCPTGGGGSGGAGFARRRGVQDRGVGGDASRARQARRSRCSAVEAGTAKGDANARLVGIASASLALLSSSVAGAGGVGGVGGVGGPATDTRRGLYIEASGAAVRRRLRFLRCEWCGGLPSAALPDS
jgi:hypothetical protein